MPLICNKNPGLFYSMLATIGFAGLLSVLSPATAAAYVEDDVQKQALAFSQAALGRAVGDYSFTDMAGKAVRLSDFQGKPLVINFVYTSCIQSCPIITHTLSDATEVARDALGEDSFQVISVGFDVGNDTPERMLSFARQLGVSREKSWNFLSGGPQQVAGLTDALGFQFFRSPKGFDHLDQVTVLDANGVVYRQVYGESFETPHLVDPLKELVFGTAAPFSSFEDLIKKVRLFCTIYDPKADRYRFDYSIFIKFFVGSTIVLWMLYFVVRNWWRIWRNSRRKQPETFIDPAAP